MTSESALRTSDERRAFMQVFLDSTMPGDEFAPAA
jgi:hypothetical protein